MLPQSKLSQQNSVNVRTLYPSSLPTQAERLNQSATSSSQIDVLLERLIPQGTSPEKRAVIERLVTLWVEQAQEGVA